MGRAVGIDFGTTTSAISVLDGGQPIVVPSAEGDRMVPSAVAFARNGEVLVGEVAKRQALTNPGRTIRSVKREMGTSWSIDIDGKHYTPQEIAARVLIKLKRDAEAYLGEPVTDAVIAVPAYFNDAQRTATREAGQIAGFTVLRIVNDPTLAALAYGLDRGSQEQTILVVDLGGGTYDVSVLDLNDGVVEVKATSGDGHLGGEDFDRAIVDHLAQGFQDRYGVDLRTDRMAWQRLTEAAEKAKIELSSARSTRINLPYLVAGLNGPLHLETELTRAEFERLTRHLLDRCVAPIRQVLLDAGITVGDITSVVTVGGSTRMPAVAALITKSTGRRPVAGMNPDEAVAAGAALQAGILTGEVRDILLLDVTPLSLGIETKGGIFTKLIPRNTTIPHQHSEIFTTAEDNQESVLVTVFQGEREIAVHNKKLGTFELHGIPPAPRGVPQIEVTFDVDANGILHVHARDLATGKEQSTTLTGGVALAQADLDRMIREARSSADEDRRGRDDAEARNAAETMQWRTEQFIADSGGRLPAETVAGLREALDVLRDALRDGPMSRVRAAHERLSSVSQRAGAALIAQQGQPPTATVSAPPVAVRGRDVELEVTLDGTDAAAGVVVPLTLSLPGGCADCAGSGSSGGRPCRPCGGSGLVSRTGTIKVAMPAGVREGQRVRVRGRGEPGRHGGAPGDVYVLVHVLAAPEQRGQEPREPAPQEPAPPEPARQPGTPAGAGRKAPAPTAGAVADAGRAASAAAGPGRDAARREAKVLLVGEGTVGKTSLVTALRGEPFREHPRTHGIDIHPLDLPDPRTGEELTLRFWDFGGQRVYRTTHQFFFSSSALYLLVWNARAGQDKDDVRGWLHRIRARVGPGARVMIIATHADEARPDLDYAALERAFPGMLHGHAAVDNRSGAGIADLRTAVAVAAAELREGDRALSPAWAAARGEILARAPYEPQLPFSDFLAVCARHGLDDADAEALAELLHRLGQVIYHGDDDALRDMVILHPEWLSKAIGHVLDDPGTLAARGVLDHARLAEIWRPRPGEPRYARHHFPYFLRLMEKFDISYRLDDANHSLIAPLVPGERPELPWDSGTPMGEGGRFAALTCRLREPVPGLMSALTVRLSYADAGLHWREGVFLRHPNAAYASEALVQLRGGTRLSVEVRAPSPELFFHVLRDSIEYLLSRRWPGLAYEHFIGCPVRHGTRDACTGQFRYEKLREGRERGLAAVTCPECFTSLDIGELLTGFPPPQPRPAAPGSAQASLERVEEQLQLIQAGLGRVGDGVADLQARAADHAHAMRRLLTVVGTEITDCPRLFTLTRRPSAGLDRVKIHQDHFQLTLWCEHPGHWHPWPQAVYPIDRPKEWLRQVSRYAGPVLAVLRHAVPLAGAFAGHTLSGERLDHAKRELELMESLVKEIPEFADDGQAWLRPDAVLAPAAGAALRGVRELLTELDRYRQYGGLHRVQAPAGEFLWVCDDHLTEYQPGLPRVGA